MHALAQEFRICSACGKVRRTGEATCSQCGATKTKSLEDHQGGILGYGVGSALAIITAALFVLKPLVGLFVAGPALAVLLLTKRGVDKRLRQFTQQAEAIIAEEVRLRELAEMIAKELAAAKAAYQKGEHATAHRHYFRCIEAGHTDPKVRLELADCLAHTGRAEEALPILDELLTLEPSPEGIDPVLARALTKLPTLDAAHAERLLQVRALPAVQADRRLLETVTIVLARYFDQHQETGDVAAEVMTAAVDMRPEEPALILALARVRFVRKEFPLTAAACARLGGTKKTPPITALHAAALNALGDLSEQAQAVYRKHLTTHPDDEEIRARLSDGLLQSGKPQDAIAILQDGLRTHPQRLRWRHQLAEALFRSSQFDSAMADLHALLRQPTAPYYPQVEAVHLLLARCHLVKGELDSAQEELQAAGTAPETLTAWYELGHAYRARGQAERARNCWNVVHEVNPDFRDVARLRG